MIKLFVLLVLAGALLGGVLMTDSFFKSVFILITADTPSVLPIPVQGVSRRAIVDTWGSPRGNKREHQGIDIFAKRGTPVLAPVHGLVIGIGQNRLGGNIIKLLGPGFQVHYFAHLDRFGPVKEYEFVRRGDALGYVGNTGNAKGTPPHLHYGIYTYRAGAINPYPLLMAGAGDK
jgi:murein DD-endopeptidase MepM/ murein hydrolase activator NlpD